ncbi:MAG: diguanylate cyclase [Phreatobacter sp.]|uniref:GGDEF domain-containing protein n=1 Tax=Phreatobacter sp. TaxID=1966341 RepID=UPI001A420BCD|nr:diguanylate cyclase [Phreatobacter sp.]MBL8567649.1 diguanylate cyclase [Phreatobacter sp.]
MKFRVQHLQWLGGIVAAVACLALGGVSLHADLADYARYQQGSLQLARFHAVMAAANAVSAERGPANSAMGGLDVNAAALSASLLAKRQDTDRRIAEMELAVGRDPATASSLQRHLREMHERLADGRRMVDEIAERPAAARASRDVTRAIEQMFTAADSVLSLRDRLGQEIIRLNPQVSTEIILNMTAGTLREEAGRLGSYVVMMLAAGDGGSAQFLPRFDQTLVRVAELRRILADYADAFFPNGPIEAKVAEMDRRYFDISVPHARVVAGSMVLPGSPTADTFTRNYVPGMRPVEELRELIAAASQARMDGMRDHAFRLVVLSGLLTGIVILVLAMVGMIFRNGLFRPLITVREQITAIARGNLAEPGPVGRVSGEIADMFRELDILRDQQRQRHRLEQDQRHMAEQLRRLSETDMLTGLLNRRALNDAAMQALSPADGRARAIGLILFDIDHFKTVNDTFGHATGDDVLRLIATCLAPLVPASGAFARYGGEEFIVLLQDASIAEAFALSEALRRRLEETRIDQAPNLTVTGSFGVAVRPAGSATRWEELVASADRRLYLAKQSGRNRVCATEAASPPLAPGADMSATGRIADKTVRTYAARSFSIS